MIHFIYRWKDPRNQVEPLCTKYVGMTNDPNARITFHMGCHGSNKEKHDWIRELAEQGLEPLFEVIEIVYDGKEVASEREKHWVQHYLDQGCQLLNILLVSGKLHRQRRNEEETVDRTLSEVIKRKCLQCGCDISLDPDEILIADKLCFYCIPCSLPI